MEALSKGIRNGIFDRLKKQRAASRDDLHLCSIDSERYPTGEIVSAAQCLHCFPNVSLNKSYNRWIGTASVELDFGVHVV